MFQKSFSKQGLRISFNRTLSFFPRKSDSKKGGGSYFLKFFGPHRPERAST